MAAFQSLLLLSLCSYAFALPQPDLQARQATRQCTPSLRSGVSCMASSSGGGPSFYSNICPSYTAVRTTTSVQPTTLSSTITVWTPTVTIFTTPPTVSSTIVTTTETTTTVISSVTTVKGGVVTSGTETDYTTVPTTVTDYTCANTAPALSTSSTGDPDDEDDFVTLRRRQTTTPDPEPSATPAGPPCFSDFKEEFGNAGIRTACSCLGVTASTRVTTTVSTRTVTRGRTTVRVPTSVSVRSTTTATEVVTSTAVVTSTDDSTSTVPVTVPFVTTSTIYSTVRTTAQYPRPTDNFDIYFSSSGDPDNRLYGSSVDAPANQTGIDLIGFSSTRQSTRLWRLSPDYNLLLAATVQIAVTAEPQAIPFVYIIDGNMEIPRPYTAPSFSVCDGTLAPAAGQSDFIFALCSVGNRQLLAYGLPDFWSGATPGSASDEAAEAVQNGTCRVGQLRIEPVSGTLNPDPDDDDDDPVPEPESPESEVPTDPDSIDPDENGTDPDETTDPDENGTDPDETTADPDENGPDPDDETPDPDEDTSPTDDPGSNRRAASYGNTS